MTLITRGAPRVLAAALTLALSLGGALGAEASAKPPVRAGTPANLVATVTKPASAAAGSYLLTTTWTAASNTTSYKVGVTNGAGATIGGGTVTSPGWSGPIAVSAGATVHVTVSAYNGTRKGGSVTVTPSVPDVTAPTGNYSAAWPAPSGSMQTVTLTADSVKDDLSTPAQVAVSVDWGDGSTPFQTTGAVTTITHNYVLTGSATRYVPQVTLTDAAGNSRTIATNAVIIADTIAPTPTATLARTTAWAAYTKVTLTQKASDNLSPAASISRTVAWGDGTVETVRGDSVMTHVYKTAGTFPVSVTAADEAQPANTAVASAGTVTVTADTILPHVAVSLPAKSVRTSVRGWRVIKGSARDGQTGVRAVRVRIVERRGSAFYAYHPSTHSWVKTKTLAAAFQRTLVASTVPVARQWNVSVAGLTIGRLYIRATSVDHVGNVSVLQSRQQAITRR